MVWATASRVTDAQTIGYLDRSPDHYQIPHSGRTQSIPHAQPTSRCRGVLARDHGAGFREVVLLDGRDASIERFDRRARENDDAWIRHHHRLVEARGGPVLLGIMYDDLLEVVRQHANAVAVTSVVGAVEYTYELLADALREPIA